MAITCPKCGYTRQENEQTSDTECPKCGIIYSKFKITPPGGRQEPQKETVAPKKKGEESAKTPGHISGKETILYLVLAAITVYSLSTLGSCSGTSSSADREAKNIERENRMVANRLCESYIKSQAAYPGSVDISWFQGVSSIPTPNGGKVIHMNFTAKNAFGAELPFKARCMIGPEGNFVTGSIDTR